MAWDGRIPLVGGALVPYVSWSDSPEWVERFEFDASLRPIGTSRGRSHVRVDCAVKLTRRGDARRLPKLRQVTLSFGDFMGCLLGESGAGRALDAQGRILLSGSWGFTKKGTSFLCVPIPA